MEEQVCEFYQPTLSVSLNCGCYFCKEIAILFNNNETQALHSKRGGGLLGPPSTGALSGMTTNTSFLLWGGGSPACL